MSLLRLSSQSVARIVPVRSFSSTARILGPNDDLQRIAEQRERTQHKEANRKADLRRIARKRAAARLNPERSPFYQDIETALRYIRAAEVGRSPKEAVITITTNVVAQKGAAKLAGSVLFPRPIKETKICVFTTDEEQANIAKELGAVVGGVEFINQIKAGEAQIDFDRAFATPEIASQLNSVARILGPKGLMPSAKKGTVTENVGELIKNVAGSIPFREKKDCLSIPVGRVNFSDNEIINNIIAAQSSFSQSIVDQKSKKPSILGHTTIASTHGPGMVMSIK